MARRSHSSDFEQLKKLGSGSFGTVWKVRRIIDDNVYVIKIVRIAELGRHEQVAAINEVSILSHLDSPFVVKYYDSFIDTDSLNIVMEVKKLEIFLEFNFLLYPYSYSIPYLSCTFFLFVVLQ